MENLLTGDDVCKILGISRTCLWRWCKNGEFPLPMKLGGNAIRWKEQDIQKWINKRQRGFYSGTTRGARPRKHTNALFNKKKKLPHRLTKGTGEVDFSK